MVETFRIDKDQSFDQRLMSRGGGQREVRAVAPSPQDDALVAQRPTDLRHIVRTLTRVVRLEPDPARPESRRLSRRNASNDGKPGLE
jgi:hypothetical protein